jgi:hypothetical protein
MWLLWVFGAFVLGATRNFTQPFSFRAGLAVGISVMAILALYPQLRFKPQLRTLVLLPEKITTTIGARSEEYSWSDVGRLEKDGEYLIVGFRSLNAFVVPASAFTNGSSIDQVLSQLTDWRAAASRSAA